MPSNEAGRPVQPAWRRASFCAASECIEVAQRDGLIILRDSTQQQGSLLHCGAGEWRDLVRIIKAGEYDRL
jgi:Domain of unknown function (DUF397)